MFHCFSFNRTAKRKQKLKNELSGKWRLVLLSFFLFSCSSYSSPVSLYHDDGLEPNVEVYQELKKLSKIDIEAPHNYALLINTSSEDRHRNNISLSYQVLLENGYKYDDIIILDTGAEPTPVFPLTEFLTRESLLNTFVWFKKNVSQKDTLFVYVTGHGLKRVLPLNSFDIISKDLFVQNVSQINAKVKMLFIDICYWDSLSEYKLSKSIIIGVTTTNKTSSGEGFSRLFWNYFRHQRGSSIYEAFDNAKMNDKNTRLKKNTPNIFYSTPPFINLKGDKVI